MDRSAWLLVGLLFLLARKGGGGKVTPPPAAPNGPALTLAQVRELAVAVGFPDPDTAAAVAMAESRGNAFAVGDSGTSFGLWQIHAPDHPEFDASRLLDATYNAHAALLVSKSGTDWSPWTTYRTGAYRSFMPQGGP